MSWQMFQLLNIWKLDVQYEVMSCGLCVYDILYANGPSRKHSSLKPLIHEHNNQEGTKGDINDIFSNVLNDMLVDRHGVIGRILMGTILKTWL